MHNVAHYRCRCHVVLVVGRGFPIGVFMHSLSHSRRSLTWVWAINTTHLGAASGLRVGHWVVGPISDW